MLLQIPPFFQIAFLVIAVTEVLAIALNPNDCIGKVTSLANCNNADSITQKCSAVVGKQETIDCFCTQELLDAYIGCKGELRQCSLSDAADSSLDTEISNWHQACDPYVSADITTPTIADPTRTLNQDTCQTIAESCYHLSQATDACSSSYTVPADFTSCRCESSVVSLASVCFIDGGSSCLGGTPNTSGIWEFSVCAATNSPAPLTTESTAPMTTMQGSTQVDAGSASALNFGPSSTTTTSSSGAVPKYKPGNHPWTYMTMILSCIIFRLFP